MQLIRLGMWKSQHFWPQKTNEVSEHNSWHLVGIGDRFSKHTVGQDTPQEHGLQRPKKSDAALSENWMPLSPRGSSLFSP